jgi:hypothetical protein
MAPKSKDEDKSSSMPGLWKYPTFRDSPIKSDSAWLDGRRLDDGAEGLWRIHDTLYDFTKFISNHPGGEEWLELTKVKKTKHTHVMFHFLTILFKY